MKNSIHLFSNRIISFLLCLLGFSAACTEIACEYGSPAAEYGTPYATFVAKGAVVNDVSEQPIPGIRVIMEYDTSYTGENGNYEVKTDAFPANQSFLIEFADVDGEQNGNLEPTDTTATFTHPQFTDGDGD